MILYQPPMMYNTPTHHLHRPQKQKKSGSVQKAPVAASSLAMEKQQPSYVVVVKIDMVSAILLSCAIVFFALALCQKRNMPLE